MQDRIVDFLDTRVSYVAGNRERPVHEQAPVAFRALEATLTTLRGRRFYAALVGPEYRACVALRPEDEDADVSLPRWTIPGGHYARRMIADYHTKIPAIGAAFAEMRYRSDFDPSRPCVEFYRSHHDMYVMVPVTT
jgi:hypothetical protein